MAKIPWANFNSLTLRLSFLFAITTITLLAGSGTFLYRFLEREVMQRDHEELIGKVDLFRHQLYAINSPQQIVAAPGQFRDVIIGHPHLHLALLQFYRHIRHAEAFLQMTGRYFTCRFRHVMQRT